MLRTSEEDLEKALQDDEFALSFARADIEIDKEIYRCIYSPLRVFWQLYYKVRG